MVAPHSVVVHPLVLLSTVDHYNRVAKDTSKRVVGVLLGETYKGRVDVTNSYAVPFEEDKKDSDVWYLDHNYHEEIFSMFRKVNAKEKVVGWYSTGPKIRPADLEINDLMKRYCSDPVLVIIDVNPSDNLGIPTEAYRAVENSKEGVNDKKKAFVHISSTIDAFDAEQVGVEHLLRDIRDTSVSSLASRVKNKLNSLKGLQKHLTEMTEYVGQVIEEKLPLNPQILYNLQDIFNLFPNLKVDNMVKAFASKTNDMMLVLYISSLVRSILALHGLISNKISNLAPIVDESLKAEDKEGEKVDDDQVSKEKEEK